MREPSEHILNTVDTITEWLEQISQPLRFDARLMRLAAVAHALHPCKSITGCITARSNELRGNAREGPRALVDARRVAPESLPDPIHRAIEVPVDCASQCEIGARFSLR